tara:strand:- start:62 stop:769 length:708 start_codon:yes stop_codon:yes gene_type:complete
MLNRLYQPDGSNLNTMIWGQAGSGKTVFLEETMKKFLKQNKDPNLRVFYISPKNEGFEWSKEIHFDLEKAIGALKKNRLSVFYPQMDYLENDVDEAINSIFDLQASNENSKFVIIIDDSQIFLSPRKSASSAHKRLALTGRSRNIKGIYVAHNIVFAKELESQVDVLVGFNNPSPIHYRSAIERFNFDPEPFADKIREKKYSFVWYDLRNESPNLMNPIEIGERPPKTELPKKGI